MLAPDQRLTLLDSLRPPPGFTLDVAVGTTYTLNLSALLVVPTAYALFAIGDSDGGDESKPTPIGLLDALRRTAGRVTVFCDAAQIAPPVLARRTLLGFVEDAVVPVRAPGGGVFHPKLWALRYVDSDGSYAYRLLIGTRNLTFDRSWDTMTVLDSDPEGQPIAGVGDFLRALPGMALVGPPPAGVVAVSTLASELDRARFTLPDGFTKATLHSFGMHASPWPFPDRCDRLLVVSPFLSAQTLDRMPEARLRRVLVSRPEALSGAGQATAPYTCFTLNPVVLDQDIDTSAGSVGDPGRVLNGLHVKLYVIDADRGTTWWTGSANATEPAFSRNVEVLLEMAGSPGRHGVNALLRQTGDDDSAGKSFRDLLLEWMPPEGEDTTPPEVDVLDHIRRAVADVPFTAVVAERESDEYEVTYTSDDPLFLPADVEIRCWPVTVAKPDRPAVSRDDGRLECRYPATVRTLTPFLAVELTVGDCRTVFAVRCHLVDSPANRQQRILAEMLGDNERLLRYLIALLTDEELLISGEDIERAVSQDWSDTGYDRMPLTELMVRAAAREPAQLAEVAELLTAMREAGQQPLPPELTALWDAVWQVAQEQRNRGAR
ncbi:phospholipase D family protein [Dactylosporangium sp. CA-233914]|uniref:phospholipase D family protein n=1 Tax=Dactylosporangium sp. CA-233914 TaxID=3239934 RepID=UPI003D8BF6E9